MKIGFIGLGSMSSAIIQGLKNTEEFDLNTIYASSHNTKTIEERCQALGINACLSNKELIESTDVIIIGVKPENLKDLAKEINPYLKEKAIISMAAKTPFDTLVSYFGDRTMIRIMPNLNVTINKGSTAIASYKSGKELDDFVEEVFNLLGHTYKLKEEQFSGFIAMAGSAPALIYRFINELAKAGIQEGFTKEESLAIVSQTVTGSSEYLSRSTDDPETLISKVSSKGGTTIEGLKVFDELNFNETIHKATQAIIIKDKKG